MSAPPVQVMFHVSPSGNDQHPGSEAQPFAALPRARDAVRAVNQRMTGDIVVNVKGGRYRLDAPLVLEACDSGTNGFAVTYRSAPGETAILDGGLRVRGWTRNADGRWSAPAHLPAIRQIYVNGARRSRAMAMGHAFPDLQLLEYGRGFRSRNAFLEQLVGVTGLEMVFLEAWAYTRCLIGEVRRCGDDYHLLMKQPEFFLAANKEGVQLRQPFLIENLPAAHLGEGEFYHDVKQGLLWYHPVINEEVEAAEVVVPRLEQLLVLRGTPAEPVSNLRFENLAFEHAAWTEPSRTGFIDIQANFRLTSESPLTVRPEALFENRAFLLSRAWDCVKSPANVVCHAGQDLDFAGCRFARLGGAGLDIERGSRRVRVSHCEFTDISGSGIQIGGVETDDHHPDDPRKNVREVEVADCRIHHAAVEYKGGVGVCIGYAQNVRIVHNEIHHLPYSAMSIGWGWGEIDMGGGAYPVPSGFRFDQPAWSGGHVVERNWIHDTVLDLRDGGAIYTLGRMPDTIIRENVIHDSRGDPGGIYLDEGSAEIRVERNVIFNVQRALNLHNRAQDRHRTCCCEGNVCDMPPGAPNYPRDIAAAAGAKYGVYPELNGATVDNTDPIGQSANYKRKAK